MNFTTLATQAAERAPIPDALTRVAVGVMVRHARRELEMMPDDGALGFARDMVNYPIASYTAAANTQHYEMPPEFFRLVLGPRLKYSSCLYDNEFSSLADAEDRALEETCAHADICNGHRILELGCGWGSLSLWMAMRYPGSSVTSVSNSASQRAAIEARARSLGVANLTVITADMNDFAATGQFDRVVSVEMFEHMSNWRGLLERVSAWLTPGGRLFLHVFAHRDRPYRFDLDDQDDWIARHFFTGGIMPSHGLIRLFPDLFEVEADWRWSGDHYRRTANDWLANFDRNAVAIRPILQATYGGDAGLWKRRWRLFFLATAGLFGTRGGEVWGVSQYRLKRSAAA